MEKIITTLAACILVSNLSAQVTLFSNNDPVDGQAMISLTSDVHVSSAPGSGESSSAGTGSLGIEFSMKNFYGSTQFNVFSNNHEVSSDSGVVMDFGKSLLIPQNGGKGFSSFYAGLGVKKFECLEYTGTLPEKGKGAQLKHYGKEAISRLGVFSYITTNKMTWESDSISMPVVLNAFGLYATCEVFDWELVTDGKDKGDRVNLSFLFGFTARRLGGDYGLKKNEGVRKQFLGTTAQGFNGIEYGGLLEVGDFYGRMTLTTFKDNSIDGFSGHQLQVTLGLNADLNIAAKHRTRTGDAGNTETK